MKLSNNAWHAWYYRSSYGADVPTTLCPYFWSLIGAIVLFPFNILSTCYNFLFHRSEPKCGFSLSTSTLLTLIAILVGHGTNHFFEIMSDDISKGSDFFIYISISFLIGTILCIIIIGIVVGILKLIDMYGDYQRSKPDYWEKRRAKELAKYSKRQKDKEPNWFIEGIKAVYGKYCPKIDWI